MKTWNWNNGIDGHCLDQVAVMMERLQDVEEFTRKDYNTFQKSIYPRFAFGCSFDWMIKYGLVIKVREENFTFEKEMQPWEVSYERNQHTELIELLGEEAAYAVLKEKRGLDLENGTQVINAKRYYYKAASMDAFEDVLADFLSFKDRQRIERVKNALNKTGLDEEELKSIITELLF